MPAAKGPAAAEDVVPAAPPGRAREGMRCTFAQHCRDICDSAAAAVHAVHTLRAVSFAFQFH